MLSSVKEALNKDVDVKGILTKEVNVKDFLAMEIELNKVKELLATEVKLKEFLVQEIDLGRLLKGDSAEKSKTNAADEGVSSDVSNGMETIDIHQEVDTEPQFKYQKRDEKVKRDLPVYDYTLIETMHAEHKRLRYVFNQIMAFAIEKEYKKVAGQLEIFNSEIREHYQKADIGLYSYLKTYIQIKYPKREKAFTQLSLEMKNLSIEIYYTISQSPNIPMTEKTYEGFMQEFIGVGKLLNERILREESVLFDMYQQTNATRDISSVH